MKLTDWIDQRTGIRKLVRGVLDESVPGGARWRYVWGSVLVFVFALQVLTGILLMTVYSPSATTAWSSVWYIQSEMTLGWLIRGLHHFGSQAMIILLPIHVLQVLVARAYRSPREINWWLGLGLFGLVLGLSLTGYLLPWDQKGYWATKVATNIMGLTPVVGGVLQKLVVGGSEYGHLTITRFFTLHVMVLPACLALLLIAHLALFRRHGVTFRPADAGKTAGSFWPEQLLRDSLACLAVLALLFGVVWYTHAVQGNALLDAPADPSASDYPARPEWYFLFLFQSLKFFEGPRLEVFGAIVLPGGVAACLFALPLLDKLLRPKTAHRVAMGFVIVLFATTILLTLDAFRDDRDPPAEAVALIRDGQRRGAKLDAADRETLRAWRFNRQRDEATRVADRALELAATQGIPPSGPLEMIARDPTIRGPKLFAAHCAICHRYHGHNGLGIVPIEEPTSSDLGGYASREWIRGLLDDPTSDVYFGRMKKPDGAPAHTRMSKWLAELREDYEDDDALDALAGDLDAAAAYLADESVNPGRLAGTAPDAINAMIAGDGSGKLAADEVQILRGRAFFIETCNECHSYDAKRKGTIRAPEMMGYGSPDWIERMIADPGHETRYRRAGREPAQMPPFENVLSDQDRRVLAEWLHGNRQGN